MFAVRRRHQKTLYVLIKSWQQNVHQYIETFDCKETKKDNKWLIFLNINPLPYFHCHMGPFGSKSFICPKILQADSYKKTYRYLIYSCDRISIAMSPLAYQAIKTADRRTVSRCLSLLSNTLNWLLESNIYFLTLFFVGA